MKLDKKRILRTLVQSGTGAGIAFVTAVAADLSKGSLIAAGVEFITTVLMSILMNIKKQAEEQDE